MQGSIQQRSKGSWRLRYDGPPDANGKRKQVTETVRGTKKQADQIMRERMAALDSGSYVAKHKETVAEFMHGWLATYVATNTFLRTQHGYKGYIRRYIEPNIGKVPLQKLTARQIQGIYSKMSEKGLSASTISQLHIILKEALSHAVKCGIITRNVAEAATPPRRQRKPMKMWDDDTVDNFLEIARTVRYGDIYLFAVHTGMRRSEITGLKWENVDLERGRLSVVETLQRITGFGLVQGEPKTLRSRRSIALSPEAVDLLHSVRSRQIEQSLAVGDAWQNAVHVFTESDGTPVIPDKITQHFCRVIRKYDLPHLTFHGLRHACATLLLSDNVNPKIVSELLGHSNIATTMDTYSHVLPGLQEAAVSRLGERLKRKSSSDRE